MMKTLNDYMAMNYRMEIVEDKDEGGFVVSFPELPGCITCGETVESAIANAQDAKKTWLEAAMEDGIEIHEPNSLEDILFSVTMPKAPRSVNTDMMTEDEIHAKLQEGYDDMRAGRVQDAGAAFAKFRESH
jgi:predicted RNase H-like HicB family nuclease